MAGQNPLCDKLADWSRQFRNGGMTVENIQDAFAALTDEQISRLAPEVCAAVTQARQELDAIRFGMCESGQAGEISRILVHLDSLVARYS